MSEPKNLYFISIPGFVANREDLTRTEKYIYGIIHGLSYKEGYCFASNYYLAQKAGCSESTITKTVSKIKDLGLWRVIVKTYTKDDKTNPKQLGTKRYIIPFQLEEMTWGGFTSDLGGTHPRPGGGVTSDQHIYKDSLKDIHNKASYNKEKENKASQDSSSPQTDSAEYKKWVEQKRINETKKKLKKKHGGSIPPWIQVGDHVDEMATSAPIIPEITDEYRQFIADLNQDGRAFIPDIDGQRLFNRFKEEGWTTPRIKAACRLAYISDSFWKENFTPVLFFRRTSSQSGKPINNVEKYFNMRVEGRPELIQIKQQAQKEENEKS